VAQPGVRGRRPGCGGKRPAVVNPGTVAEVHPTPKKDVVACGEWTKERRDEGVGWGGLGSGNTAASLWCSGAVHCNGF